MNREEELRVQALVDGELSEREARHVRDWLADNPQGQRLLAELTWSRMALSENEPESTVPESREFYWNKIQLAIAREDQRAPAPSLGFFEWILQLRRVLAPAAGVAMLLILVLGLVQFYDVAESGHYLDHLAQVESPSEEMGSFSFRNQSENVFVVWLYDRPSQPSLSPELLDHMIIQ